ncbi:MAG: hypothetical protein L6Q77_01070 [Bacteroidetes bacterium]|nr:hypothetical protein [Bacteroidota bacterium]
MLKSVSFIFFFFTFFSSDLLLAQDKAGFADDLYKQQDYFRAISVWKEMKYFESTPERKSQIDLWIAESYLKSSKPVQATYHISEILNREGTTADTKLTAYFLLARSYQDQSNFIMARTAIEESREIEITETGFLLNASFLAEEGRYEEAKEELSKLRSSSGDSLILRISAQLFDLVSELLQIEPKSEVTAGLFSAFIPGSGQAYTGHWIDGLNAFGMTALFGFGTWAVWKAEKTNHEGYPLTATFSAATGLFYYANILGAVKTTRFANKRLEEKKLVPLRKLVSGAVVLPAL